MSQPPDHNYPDDPDRPYSQGDEGQGQWNQSQGGWDQSQQEYQQQEWYSPQDQPAYQYQQQGYDQYGQQQWEPVPEGQSRFGIAGIVLFIIAMLLAGVGFFLASTITPSMDPNNAPPEQVISGFLMIGAIGLNLLGAILSIAGFFEKSRHKMTAIVGLALNLMICLGCGGLIALGIVAVMSGFQA